VGAWQVLRSAPTVFVRTARHPAVDDLIREGVCVQPLDDIYDTAATFDHVYAQIAERILSVASEMEEVVYAVPGHPLIGEESVRILLREASNKGVAIRIIGSESFIEAAMEALGVALGAGIKVLDALSLADVSPDPDVPNLIYQVYDPFTASDVKLRLLDVYPDDFQVTVVSGAGTDGQRVETVPLHRLDRCECDHLTTVFIPALTPLAED